MAMLKRPTKAAPIIPSLAEVSPEYAALLEKKSTLQAASKKLEAEAATLRESLREFRPDGGRAARVAELLGDDTSD